MKKKIICAVLASALMAAALCGCGESKESTTAAPAATEAITKADTEAPADTEAFADTSAPAATGLREAAKASFNGVTFGVGDKASDVVAQLGDQVKPSDSSQPCIPGAGEIIHYYFNGMSIDASQFDVIRAIYFNTENGEGTEAKTVSGVGLGSTIDELRGALGTEEYADEYGASFKDGQFGVSVVFDDDGKAMAFSIEDMDIEL